MYTERGMLDALHLRYGTPDRRGNLRYICAEHVRSSCGYSGAGMVDGKFRSRRMRTADFLAQDLREGSGNLLHGHEVKVSRSDWLSELRDESKATAVKRYCDRWWLVVPDRGIVRDDLPEGWGLMAFDKAGKLRVYKSAPQLEPLPHPPTFRASLMKAAAKTAARRALDFY